MMWLSYKGAVPITYKFKNRPLNIRNFRIELLGLNDSEHIDQVLNLRNNQIDKKKFDIFH